MQEFWPNIGRFVLYSILTGVAVVALMIGLYDVFGVRLGSGTNILTVMLPALFVGMRYAKSRLPRPSNMELLKYAVVANLFMIAISLAFLAVLGQLAPLQVLFQLSAPILAAVIAFFVVVYIGATFAFFRLGYRNQMKTGGDSHG